MNVKQNVNQRQLLEKINSYSISKEEFVKSISILNFNEILGELLDCSLNDSQIKKDLIDIFDISGIINLDNELKEQDIFKRFVSDIFSTKDTLTIKELKDSRAFKILLYCMQRDLKSSNEYVIIGNDLNFTYKYLTPLFINLILENRSVTPEFLNIYDDILTKCISRDIEGYNYDFLKAYNNLVTSFDTITNLKIPLILFYNYMPQEIITALKSKVYFEKHSEYKSELQSIKIPDNYSNIISVVEKYESLFSPRETLIGGILSAALSSMNVDLDNINIKLEEPNIENEVTEKFINTFLIDAQMIIASSNTQNKKLSDLKWSYCLYDTMISSKHEELKNILDPNDIFYKLNTFLDANTELNPFTFVELSYIVGAAIKTFPYLIPCENTLININKIIDKLKRQITGFLFDFNGDNVSIFLKTTQKFKEIKKSVTQLDVVRKENKELLKTIKQLKNELTESNKKANDKQIAELDDQFTKIKSELNIVSKTLKDNTYDTLKRTYEGLLNRNNDELANIKANNKELRSQLKDEKEKFEDYKNAINNEFILKYISENIENIELLNSIKKIVGSDLDTLEEPVSTQDVIEDIKGEPVNKVCFATIQNGLYVGTLGTGKNIPIQNIPKNEFIADKAFVVVDSNNNYLYKTSYYHNGDILSMNTNDSNVFSIVKTSNNKIYYNYENRPISLTQTNKTIDTVGLIQDGKLVKMFKRTPYIADFYMESIINQGYSVYYITNIVNKFAICRNIINNEEALFNDKDYVENTLLIVNNENNEDITIITGAKFYTKSSYYGEGKYGVISFKNNVPYFTDSKTDETFIIKNVPISCVDGDVIRVDEHNNFIEMLSLEGNELGVKNSIKRSSIIKKNNKNIKLDEIDIKGSVLIIGNISYQLSYKTAALKKGYIATVINGYETYNKVYKEALKADVIIISESFIDHNIMWAIKDKYANTNKRIIFSDKQGANILTKDL